MKRFDHWICMVMGCIAIHCAAHMAFAGCDGDADADGICDSSDRCPNTIPGATVNLLGCPQTAPGDFDADGDVDLDDFIALTACMSGPDNPASLTAPCPDADFDFDLDVDLADAAAFNRCFSGANLPADPNCLPHVAGIVSGCLHIVGTGASTNLAIRLSPVVPSLLLVDVGDDGTHEFSFSRTQFFCINIFARGGHDQVRIDESFGDITSTEITTLDGGSGNDTLLGGNGPETFIGGEGNDFVDAGPGSDAAFLGAGDDTFKWDPGDGSDTVEGEAGHDLLLFNGSNAAENVFISDAGGTRLVFFRDVGNITIDGDGIEQVDFNAFGGADIIFVDRLVGTDVLDVNIDLASSPGSGTGDAQTDAVIVNGTIAMDNIALTGGGTSASVTGLSASVHITNAELALDRLTVNALAENDTVVATGLAAGVIVLTLNGGPGNDTLTGSGGDDFLNGEDDNDTIIGGVGDDFAFMGLGNDRFIWNPGDGSDLAEGEGGIDTVEVNGGNGSEVFSVTANGTRVRFDRLDPSPFDLDIGTCEHLILNANDGDDSFSATGNLAALIAITADGGPGEDALFGSNGIDILIGGDDDDFVDGQQGNDVVFLGAGNDAFRWDPGDGSDTVEGQAGHDTLIFNGSNGAEIFEFAANGGRLRFTRNLGNIVMDCDDIEQVDLNTLGSVDNVIVNDLTGTDLFETNISLAGTLGGGAGDAQVDTVIVNGTAGLDNVTVAGGGTALSVTGLSAIVNVAVLEPASDLLTINGLGGDDMMSAVLLPGGVVGLTLNGGIGDDTLIGSGGDDILNGEDNNDTIMGGNGDDIAFMGLGNDRFIWNPGDDTDLVEGEGGSDTIEVNGGNGPEVFTVTANGTRVRFDRLDPAPFSLDIGTSENLILNANDGDDSFSATGNLAALIAITADGGPGEDTLLGSNGIDILIGGDDDDFIDGQQGNDVVFLGAGDDTFRWDPGDGSDIIEGQSGHDVLEFNGSNANEIYDFSAVGTRLRLTRNIGNVIMDCHGLEQVDLSALGGTDNIVVNDLTATDVFEVNAKLAGTIGGMVGDTVADSVIINATGGDDMIFVSGSGQNSTVLGLAAQVNVTTSEVANDGLRVNMLAGDDVLDASQLAAGVIQLTVDGGDDNDVITGSDGPDVLLGGNGDDVLIGGLGVDVLDGGPGNNIIFP